MVTSFQLRAICLTLRFLRGALVLALPASIGLLWITIPQAPDLSFEKGEQQMTDPPKHPGAHDLAWYAPLWERDLKQPPIPPAVTEPPVERQEDSGPVPTLLATLVEPDARYAHLRDPAGRVRLKQIDEAIGRFRVAAIEPGRVKLDDGRREVWIEVPKRKGQQ